MSEGDLRLGLKQRRQPLKHSLVGVVVRFGDPDVLPTCQTYPLISLLERASGIHFVEFDSHSRITTILGENRSAFVSGTVVQQDQFEILESLSQDALDPPRQKTSMVVVRYDHLTVDILDALICRSSQCSSCCL